MPNEKRPAVSDRAPSTTSTLCPKDSKNRREFDYDETVVYQVDSSIWRAIFNGEFRLAVPCDQCGRWLTDGRSKRNHRGPRCAAKVVG